MPSTTLRKFKSIFTENGSCTCNKKAVDVVKPEPKSRTSDPNLPRGPSSPAAEHGGENDNDNASTAISPNIAATAAEPECSSTDNSPYLPERVLPRHPSPKIYNSFAVVKNSDDPYADFRKSMIQMIVEREIYTRAELQQLLDCFLRLNPPQHHEIIIRAFTETLGGKGAPAQFVVAPPSDRSTKSI